MLHKKHLKNLMAENTTIFIIFHDSLSWQGPRWLVIYLFHLRVFSLLFLTVYFQFYLYWFQACNLLVRQSYTLHRVPLGIFRT